MDAKTFAIWMALYCKVARRCECSGCLAEGMGCNRDKMQNYHWSDILRRIIR